jgi:glycosyltransferase involved in cell wall biosynthesis
MNPVRRAVVGFFWLLRKYVKVSVLVTTYNRVDQLPFAVDSIIKQTFSDFELILIDDASKDETETWVREDLLPRETRVKYIRNKENQGLARSRNLGISMAQGEFFAFCDDDDLWETNFLSTFLAYAREGKVDIMASGFTYLDAIGREVEVWGDFEGEMKDYIMKGFTPPVASQFYRTKILKEIGGYREEIKTGVDHDLWISLALKGFRIKTIPESLARPNSDLNLSRMTNRHEERLKGIENSIHVWEESLIELGGKAFFKKFKKAYFRREKSKILYALLLKNGILEGMRYWICSEVRPILLIKFLVTVMMVKYGCHLGASRRKVSLTPSLKIS